MQEQISVIVPIYNVEAYLEKCVKTIQSSTYENLQIILVDDGSTDTSPQICDRMKEKDERIEVIHKENGGLSSARNAGLKIAKGEYISFIDSDDYISEDMYENMLKSALKYNADITQCGYQKVDENANVIFKTDMKDCILGNEKEIRDAYFIDKILAVIVCNKLYKYSVTQGIIMMEGRNNEDNIYMTDIIAKLKCVVILKERYYYYLQRSDSIMNCSFSEKKLDSIYAYDYALKRCCKDMPEYAIYIKHLICLNCFYLYHAVYQSKAEYKYYKMIEDEYKKYRKEVLESFHTIKVEKKLSSRLRLFDRHRKLAIILYHWYLKIMSK
ncbi:MAG: glycosyltransferase [Lachnospiraceae bacterium]